MTKKKSASCENKRKNHVLDQKQILVQNGHKLTAAPKKSQISKKEKNNPTNKQKRKELKFESQKNSNQNHKIQSYLINCSKPIKNPFKFMFQKNETSDIDCKKQAHINSKEIQTSEKEIIEEIKDNLVGRKLDEIQLEQGKKLDCQNKKIVLQNENEKQNEKLTLLKNNENMTTIKLESTQAFHAPIVEKQAIKKQSIEKMQNQILEIINQLENELNQSALESKFNSQQINTEKTAQQKYKQKQKQIIVEKQREKVDNPVMFIFQNQRIQKLNKSLQKQSIDCQSPSEEHRNHQITQNQLILLSDKPIRRIYIPKMEFLQKSKNKINGSPSLPQFIKELRKITDKKSKKVLNCDKQPNKKYTHKKYLIQISLFNENIPIQNIENKKIKSEKNDLKNSFKIPQKQILYKINYYSPQSQTNLTKKYTLINNLINIPDVKLVKTEFMLKSKLLKIHQKQFVEYLESTLMKIRKGKQGGEQDPIILENKLFLEQTMMTMVSTKSLNFQTTLKGNKNCKTQTKNLHKRLRSFSKKQNNQRQNISNFEWSSKQQIEH